MIRGKSAIKRLSGIAVILYFAALLIFMRRTIISHFSFLISHSSESFNSNQGTLRPPGLTPNLEPRTPNYAIIEARTPTYFLKER